MSTDQLPATVAPSDLVRPLHSLLAHQLALTSPLGAAVEMLDRAARLSFGSQGAVQSAEAARRALARAVAVGDVQFNEAAVRALRRGPAVASRRDRGDPAGSVCRTRSRPRHNRPPRQS